VFSGITAGTGYAYSVSGSGLIQQDGVSDVDGNEQIDISMLPNAREDFSMESLNLYPNPARNFVIVSGVQGELKYSVLNPAGEILSSGITENSRIVFDLKPGMYFVRMEQNGLFQVRKLMIQ